MTFSIIKSNELENPEILQINRLPPRSNLIPSDKRDVYYKNKEESVRLQSLNGDYRFAYRQEDSINGFYATDFDDTAWDTIDVPSMWQYRGYGKCTYSNTEYPFPFDPPYIRVENPVGYYRKAFTTKPSERTVLHFGGVDNAFYVYLNGSFVGFSKGSRNPAEFDITPFIKNGENLLAVKVFTYSDASYLENQDMLLASGIFRDVYIIHTEKVSVWDFKVTSDERSFNICVELTEVAEDTLVEIELDGKRQVFRAEKQINARFDLDDPKFWSDEDPNLYPLYITLKKGGVPYEIHSKKIGIISSEIKNGKLLVNGKPIYVKGINRHEYDCDNGRAISVSLIEKELRLIKENNINAIRCSHYTNNPAFYEICSEIGIMVMDECDLETHGCEVTGDQGYLSKRPEWLRAYLDRAERSVKQNKNEPCIFMRSVQNECGKGENILACQKYLGEYCPNIAVIHDQQQTRAEITDKANSNHNTVLRGGYLPREVLERVIEAQPLFFQVEYAHAMGNSPGFLKGYQDMVYENDNYIGGFAWEFKNHGFRKYDSKGNAYYLYGGDFGERAHWYNFCLDGYLMSDGTPKHSWYELGAAFAPIYTTFDGGIKIKNTYNFKSLDGYSCQYEILEDYSVKRAGAVPLPALAPHADAILSINTHIENPIAGADYYINLSFFDGEKFVCRSQLKLPTKAEKKTYDPSGKELKTELVDERILVSGADFSVEFKDGVISRYERSDITVFDKPFDFTVFRAHIDNDGILMEEPWFHKNAEEWRLARLDDMHFYSYGMRESSENGTVVIKTSGKIIPTGKYLGFEVDIIYTVYPSGIVLTEINASPFGKLPGTLPRFGVHFTIDKKYDSVEWYGRGERENYSDCKLASPIGLYKKRAEETYTIFDMPQNSGNHEDTAYLRLLSQGEVGLSVIGCDEFAFTYRDVVEEALDVALHKNEVDLSAQNHLYVDYKMRGLGSASCGPEPEEEFEFRPHSFRFAFAIGAGLSRDEALDLRRLNLGASAHRSCAEAVTSSTTQTEERNLL